MAIRRVSGRGRKIARRLLPLAVCGVVVTSFIMVSQTPQHGDVGATGNSANAAHSGQAGRAASADAAHAHGAAPGAVLSAPELTLQLQQFLGQHSVLAADMMRGRLRGDPDFVQAANAALGKNTDAVGDVVGSLFGQQARTQFAPLWATHVTALFNYARGLSEQNVAVRAAALKEVGEFENDLAEFFAKASQGRLRLGAAKAAMRMHIGHLVHQADEFAAMDYAHSGQLYRAAYAHTFALGKDLAIALLPTGTSAALAAPKWRLRSEMGRLLGEHVALVVAAMRAGVTNSKDFGAAGEAVDGNTRDLTGAIDALYGPAAAKAFQPMWADHIDQLMVYTSTVVTKDADGRAASLAKLRSFEGQLAAFLGTATGNRMAAEPLTKAFLMHDEMLVRQVDLFAAKKYQEAHDLTYSTYQQMFDLAGQLADAIGATVAARLPRGGAQTGGGGMGAVVGRR